ncbi:hypothetical protein LPUS_08503 [Lasallia pustulata]|uniref:Uncharacterized protein n=1 Tax=Lasallia pustulata TaxID=136370 RepID=A0A1W5D5R3_9LECA|nr:hypothetical protein LPUS_08503 [Lasallia pustulata]
MRIPPPSLSLFLLLFALVHSQQLNPISRPTTASLPTPLQPPPPDNSIAITTFPSPTTAPAPPHANPYPTPLDDAQLHEGLRRQAAGVGAAGGSVNSPGASQLPAVTSWVQWSSVKDSGTWTPLSFVYTQLFSPVPEQGPSAASGNIGMGTLTGVVGAVKTDEFFSTFNWLRGSDPSINLVQD